MKSEEDGKIKRNKNKEKPMLEGTCSSKEQLRSRLQISDTLSKRKGEKKKLF